MVKYKLNIDSTGRIVIPKNYRKKLGLTKDDQLDIILTKDNKLILQKHCFNIKYEELIRNALISIQGIEKKDYFISTRQKSKFQKLITSFINEEFKDVNDL